jgi:large subunit ribosomal protein L15
MSMIHDITATAPRYKAKQRKGRGESSGRGKTSGRGNKGSKARVGTYIRRGYEGGQTETHKRFPKRGFNNVNFERKFYIVNLVDLEQFDNGATIDAPALEAKGLIPDLKLDVKILGTGKLSKKLTIVAGWYSKGAHEQITAAGGSALNTKNETFQFPKVKKKFVKREAVKKPKGEAAAEEARPAEAKPE